VHEEPHHREVELAAGRLDTALDVDDLLLKLNLIAINASVSPDLRYLDALNYYYELLPAGWYPESPQNWLRVSFLTFYARALEFHFNYL